VEAERIQGMDAAVKRFTEEELASAAAALASRQAASSSTSRPSRKRQLGDRRALQPLQGNLLGRHRLGRHPAKLKKSNSGEQIASAVPAETVKPDEVQVDAAGESATSTHAHKPQVDMPKEEDLNNWSHHFNAETTNDEYLREAVRGTDLVSFVFGLEVSWDLTKKQMVIDKELETQHEVQKIRSLEEARQRLGQKRGKKSRKKQECEVPAEDRSEDPEQAHPDQGSQVVSSNHSQEGDQSSPHVVAAESGDDPQASDPGTEGETGAAHLGDKQSDKQPESDTFENTQIDDESGSQDQAEVKESTDGETDASSALLTLTGSSLHEKQADAGTSAPGACPLCTFQNNSNAKKCRICQTPLQSAKGSAKKTKRAQDNEQGAKHREQTKKKKKKKKKSRQRDSSSEGPKKRTKSGVDSLVAPPSSAAYDSDFE